MLARRYWLMSLALLALSGQAAAQDAGASAPAMFNVREVLMQYARIGNSAAADSCGISREDEAVLLAKTVKDAGVPLVAVTEAKPPLIGVARIELVPEIVSLSEGGECTSWVALSAQSQNTVRVPPIETPRNVIVTYWRSGLLVNSGQSSHGRIVGEAIQKLGKQFSEQFRLDQPPPLPVLDGK